MQINRATAVLDLKQVLSWKQIGELESDLGEMNGVTRAQVSTRVHRLVIVDYDPETVNSQNISALSCVADSMRA